MCLSAMHEHEHTWNIYTLKLKCKRNEHQSYFKLKILFAHVNLLHFFPSSHQLDTLWISRSVNWINWIQIKRNHCEANELLGNVETTVELILIWLFRPKNPPICIYYQCGHSNQHYPMPASAIYVIFINYWHKIPISLLFRLICPLL